MIFQENNFSRDDVINISVNVALNQISNAWHAEQRLTSISLTVWLNKEYNLAQQTEKPFIDPQYREDVRMREHVTRSNFNNFVCSKATGNLQVKRGIAVGTTTSPRSTPGTTKSLIRELGGYKDLRKNPM